MKFLLLMTAMWLNPHPGKPLYEVVTKDHGMCMVVRLDPLPGTVSPLVKCGKEVQEWILEDRRNLLIKESI